MADLKDPDNPVNRVKTLIDSPVSLDRGELVGAGLREEVTQGSAPYAIAVGPDGKARKLRMDSEPDLSISGRRHVDRTSVLKLAPAQDENRIFEKHIVAKDPSNPGKVLFRAGLS